MTGIRGSAVGQSQVGQAPKFPKSLRAWQTDAFDRTLKGEVEDMNGQTLPLSAGTSQGGFVDDHRITATVLTVTDDECSIVADVGVFFTEIVAGCSCGDEPDSINAYCRMQIRIDKTTAEAEIDPVSD
jgi:hypothetical protein